MATETKTVMNPYGAITENEVKTHGPERPPEFTDEAAAKLVVQDAARAELWLDSHQWGLFWRESDILYQSPRTTNAWENSPTTTRANVSRFTVAKHVNSLVPTMKSGIFYDSPPFVLRPRPSTSQSSCRAWTALLSAMLEQMDFEAEVETGMESQCLNGTAIFKYGCYTETVIEKKFKRKTPPARVEVPFEGQRVVNTAESDEFEVVENKVTRWRMFFEQKALGTILVDPGWRKANQIHKAKYVIERAYPTFTDLDKLRQQKGYNIPSEEELKAYFFPQPVTPNQPSQIERQQEANTSIHHAEGRATSTTVDPLEQPIEMLERWDSRRVITVLQGRAGGVIIIRNEEHGLGRIPYLSCNWWNILNAGYGLGIGRLIGADQRVEQGSTNAALDILSMAVNQQYLRSRGANVPTQQIRSRLGGIIDVDGDIDKAFRVLDPPKVPGEVWSVIANAKQSSEAMSGADEAMVQGSLPQRGGSSIGRTATGAGNLAAAAAARIQGPVGRFVKFVFIPFISAAVDLIKERMPLSEIRAILGEELADELQLDVDDFLNAKLRYEVLAGAHLAAKKAMAQSLPLMIQIFENPHMLESLNATGWTVDLKELFDMFMEMSEWKNTRNVVRRMNNKELEMYSAVKNQMPAKLQGDMAKIEKKGEVDARLVDQKAEASLAEKLLTNASDRATGYVSRVAMERAMEPRALGTEDAQYHTTQ